MGSVLAAPALAMLVCACGAGEPAPDADAPHWWKGNLHTHSLWSDGDDYPEMIVDWYRSHGYHFVALSDHNTLAEDERWHAVGGDSAAVERYRRYVERFGEEWVDAREDAGTLQVRLKTLGEYRTLFERPGRFLVIQGEEITDRFGRKPIHVNATNVAEQIDPQGGGSVLEVMQNNVDAVLEQRRRTGRPMFPHLNHPNFGWAVTVEDLVALRRERFFEVYNGHPLVHNEGDHAHPGTERMWDIVLTERLRQARPLMYGLAVDDAHHYQTHGADRANPGRGWVMVRAPALTAEAIIAALEAGDFYATTGVELEAVESGPDGLRVRIRPEPGVTYTTRFIGTRRTGDRIGVALAEVDGASAAYRFRGDELYVRAKIVSSKRKANPYRKGEVEVAWTQPATPGGS